MASPLILIVEDDEVQRDLLRSILELEGYRVAAADEGHRALEMASAEPPRVIITDNCMPGLDGYSLIDAIRADEALASVPIVLLSAGDEDVRANRRRLRPGLDHFMQKPIQSDELLGVLRRAVSGSGAPPPAVD